MTQHESLWDFTDSAAVAAWQPKGDPVMGGHSAPRLEPCSDGARFIGRVSLENDGGFASVVSPEVRIHAADTEGLIVLAAGDGRTYRVSVRCERGCEQPSWKAAFTPGPDIAEVVLPWNAFTCRIGGETVDRPIADEVFTSVDIMTDLGTPGEFALTLDNMSVARRG